MPDEKVKINNDYYSYDEALRCWTKEEFDTGLPYQTLWEIKSSMSAFDFALALKAISEHAASVGYRGFKAMWKEYCRTVLGEIDSVNDVYGNATHFTGQEITLESGHWECGDDGVKRRSAWGEEIACRHPILPVERMTNIDTGVEKLKLAYRKGHGWRSIVIDKTVLASSNKVTELASVGIAVTSQNAKSFIEYISDIENLNYEAIPERKSIGRLGYIEGEGFSPYVDGLTFDGDAAFRSLFETVKSYGSFEEWLSVTREVRGMSIAARIVVAASFASALLQPINSLPFFVHLWGVDSGTGKTVALMVAASVWGNPAVGAYVKTFDGTVVGHEKTAAFLNNLPFCMDELQLAKDMKGQTRFDVYKLAQGVGRTRGNAAGGIDITPTWRNCIITTGESPLTGQNSGAGAINRVIDIECRANQAVITDGMRVSGIVKRNYGYAGRAFVEELYKPGVVDDINERYHDIVRELSERDTTEKQAMAAAAILLADELSCRWIFKGDSPMTTDDISEFLASKAAVSAGDRGYRFLCDWVTQNSAMLQCTTRDDTVNAQKILGVMEGRRAYIIRSVFIDAVQGAGFSPSALISYLKQNHLIETRAKNNTKAKRINGIPTECFCLLMPDIDEETEDDIPL